jgi:Fe2+ or Zn2+ uptake regulation protein
MTERKRIEYQEKKIEILNKRGWLCEKCGKPLDVRNAQLAHRIPQTKGYLKQYGKDVIHHELNMACVCSLGCNSAILLDPKTHPIEAKELIEKIKERLYGTH